MDKSTFRIVGADYIDRPRAALGKCRKSRKIPHVSSTVLGIIILGCLLADVIMTHDPSYLNLADFAKAPNSEYWFGTDTMGRDIFSMIWYGGRISLCIGLLATAISTTIAVIYGTIAGIATKVVDNAMMRLTEIFLSIPSILIVIFVQAIIGQSNVVAISFVIGVTSWMSIAKIVRSEVRQIYGSEYVQASKCMGGGFFHILVHHLAPNFISAIMFMVVINISSAIATESTLSFLGIGLPVEIISWGSMLSLAQNALLTGAWWIIVITGLFLVATVMSITNLGNYLRRQVNIKESNL